MWGGCDLTMERDLKVASSVGARGLEESIREEESSSRLIEMSREKIKLRAKTGSRVIS